MARSPALTSHRARPPAPGTANAAKRDAPPPAHSRVAAVDVARGLAIVAMIAYHFAYDLRYFGVIDFDFEHDPRTVAIRTLILSSFLLIAGVSLVLADRGGVPASRFYRHVATIAGCALLVSVGSYTMFPRTYIWFGVLHAIAVSLVLARPLVRRPAVALVLGLAVIAMGIAYSNHAFDNRALGWIGFMTSKPFTQDYVPLFPWAGAVLVGIAAGHALAARDFAPIAALARAPRPLATLGRHALLVYMVHQPIMIGVLWLVLRH